jgi:PST family polysaccharide transporter
VPITIACALFADDIVLIVLGPKWTEAVAIFRLLAPTILIFAMINPLSWLLFSLGMVGRSLKVALVLAPLVIAAYVIGLPYGPKGVALGYSTMMTLWVIPHLAWCVHGTVISVRDALSAAGRPLLSGLVAAAFAAGLQPVIGGWGPFPKLVVESSVLLGAYLGMLLFVMGQKTLYLNLLRELRTRSPIKEKSLVSV